MTLSVVWLRADDKKGVKNLCDNERYLKCPLCRFARARLPPPRPPRSPISSVLCHVSPFSQELLVPSEGIQSFKANFALLEVIEAFSASSAAAIGGSGAITASGTVTSTDRDSKQAQAQASGGVGGGGYTRCAECEDSASVPSVFCVNCSAELCDTCDRRLHGATGAPRVMQRHERMPSEKKHTVYQPKCAAHPTKELDVFCVPCMVAICIHCRDYGEHKVRPHASSPPLPPLLPSPQILSRAH
jgi:hypothetical protein